MRIEYNREHQGLVNKYLTYVTAYTAGEQCFVFRGSGSAVRGGVPAVEEFSCILCHQIASPGTSVYSFVLAVVSRVVYAYIIGAHFHDTPDIHLRAPSHLGARDPATPVPMSLKIYMENSFSAACPAHSAVRSRPGLYLIEGRAASE